MREAVKRDETLCAPSVGTWRPAVTLGSPLVPGALLGVLWRDQRAFEIHAPSRVGGVVVQLTPAGTWVDHGAVLLEMGEGSGSLGTASAVVASDGPEGAVAVTAATDGTVFLAPEPGAPPFAGDGTTVQAHATVALVEVMKTFTAVKSPVAGTVVRVDVDDGGSVAEGDALMWVRPS